MLDSFEMPGLCIAEHKTVCPRTGTPPNALVDGDEATDLTNKDIRSTRGIYRHAKSRPRSMPYMERKNCTCLRACRDHERPISTTTPKLRLQHPSPTARSRAAPPCL